jgi:hypothetical protein
VTRWVCEKIAQNVAQPSLCMILCLNLSLESSISNISDTSVIFKYLSKINNHLLGEKSPNLVTLVLGQGARPNLLEHKQGDQGPMLRFLKYFRRKF